MQCCIMLAGVVGPTVRSIAVVVYGYAPGAKGGGSRDERGDPEPETALEAGAELIGGDGGGTRPIWVSHEPSIGVWCGGGDEAGGLAVADGARTV